MDISSIGDIDKHARQAIAFLERDTVEMRAEIPDFCHAKAYIFKNNAPTHTNYYVTGSSNLTPAGIGLKTVPNVELNIAENCNSQNADYIELRKWYDDIWSKARTEVPEDSDNKKSPKIPVKEYFIRKIKEYFRKYSPEEIYYKILYELFNSDLDLESGIEHQKDMGLLQTSEIWNKLFNYQQKGVISLIKMLRKYNGAILADAVGLGKTFSALAVIKYFETQNYTTVVLCPKKLQSNWTQYLKGADSLFEDDRFDYVVRFHTDFQNERMQRYELYKLDYLQKLKKVLVVIDESHNLRNEKSSRYIDLMESLIKNQPGEEQRDVKVLMLSATPINTGCERPVQPHSTWRRPCLRHPRIWRRVIEQHIQGRAVQIQAMVRQAQPHHRRFHRHAAPAFLQPHRQTDCGAHPPTHRENPGRGPGFPRENTTRKHLSGRGPFRTVHNHQRDL